jgi:hypothetical protein
LRKWWLKVGYNAVVEDVCHELENIEFCQSHPVEVEGHWVMVRSPLKSLTKDCLTLQSTETAAQIGASYMAISTCGRIINSGVPISYALHNCLFRASGKYAKLVEISDEFMFKNVEYGNYERMKGLRHVRRKIADSTRLSYYKAFEITPQTQILLEEYYNQLDLDFGQGVENVNSIEFYSAFSTILLDKPSLW